MKFPCLSFALLVAICLPNPLRAEESLKLETVRSGGGEYVAAEQIGRLLEMELVAREGNKRHLSSRTRLMELEVGSPVCTINHTRFIFDGPVIENEGRLLIPRANWDWMLDPVLRPGQLKGGRDLRTVILDPGHGGKDRGPASEHGDSADYALAIATQMVPWLTGEGFQVVMTRKGDEDVSPDARVELANEVPGAAVFIGIHFARDPDAGPGFATSAQSSRDDTVGPDAEARAALSREEMGLATAVHGSLCRKRLENGAFRQTADRGIRASHDAAMPA